MPHLPYPDLDADEATRVAAQAARGARTGRMLNLYRMLLHSPRLATAWLALGSHLRYHGTLDERTRELVTCHVGTRAGSAYELHHHAPLALRAGVSRKQLDALASWQTSELFDDRDRRLLGYVDATVDGTVGREEISAVRRDFSDAQLVELTALVAYYLGVSRFVRALDVDIESDRETP